MPTEDDWATLALMSDLKGVRARGYLTKRELERVCYWKSARAIGLVKANPPWKVRSLSGRALAAESDRTRLQFLIRLKGVGVPMASAILMLVDPTRFAVVDIRVWQVLYAMRSVDGKSSTNLGVENGVQYLSIVRRLAKLFMLRPYDIQRALFETHKRFQKGRLYE